MRLVLAILAGAWIGIGCSEKEPAPASKKSGLKLAPRPEKKSAPSSPEALARAFQKTLATNNAELVAATKARIEATGRRVMNASEARRFLALTTAANTGVTL